MSGANTHEKPWDRVERLERERRELATETPWGARLRRLHDELMATADLLDEDDRLDDPPRLTAAPESPAAPTTAELIEALQAPGPLADQRAVQRLLRHQRLRDSVLRLEEQARDRQRAASPGLRLVRDGESQDVA